MLTAESSLLPVNDDEKSCLVKTQVWRDFSLFQLLVWIGAWGLVQGILKEKDLLTQAQELLSLSFVSEPKRVKCQFLEVKLKSHFKRWLCQKIQPTWHKLIPFDSSWHWLDTEQRCASAQQVVVGGPGTDTPFTIVIIVSDNLALIHLDVPLGFKRSRQRRVTVFSLTF